MEVLAGAAAVLVPAALVIASLVRPARTAAEPPDLAPALTPALTPDLTPDLAPALASGHVAVVVEPHHASAPVEEPPVEEPPVEEPPVEEVAVEESREALPAPSTPSSAPPTAGTGPFAHAPVFAQVAAPMTVTVRVLPAPARPVPTERGPRPWDRQSSTVLGVFSDTEPDGRTGGVRRTTSALVLAAVTLTVASGVGGAIYLGLRRLG